MKKNSGYSLIEVIIALLIGAMLVMLLYRSFTNTVRMSKIGSAFIDDQAGLVASTMQLERDLSSIVWLPLVDNAPGQKAPQPPAPGTSIPATPPAQEPAKKPEQGKRGDDAQGTKIKERVLFKAIAHQKGLEISFVTTSVLPELDRAQSRLAMVHYALVPQRDDPQLLELTREERAYYADTRTVKKEDRRVYMLMSHIRSCTVTCYAHVVVPAGEKKPVLKSTGSWGTPEQKKNIPLDIPEYIRIEGIYQSRSGAEVPFSRLFAIPIGITKSREKLQEQKPPEPQAPAPQELAKSPL